MKILPAKELAKSKNFELWWQRSISLWTVTALSTKEEPNRDVNTPATYLSPAALRQITPEKFEMHYLRERTHRD